MMAPDVASTAKIDVNTHILTDTRLAQELQQLQLPQGPQAKHRVVERHDLLDRDLPPARPVHGRTNDTVRTLADNV